MNDKPQLLELLKLLSAIESWSFAVDHPMPDYLKGKLDITVEVVTKEILK